LRAETSLAGMATFKKFTHTIAVWANQGWL
jgi:hypothetical protein